MQVHRGLWLINRMSGCEETLGVGGLTGDNAPDVTESSPIPQCENGERPPQDDRSGQDLPKNQHLIGD